MASINAEKAAKMQDNATFLDEIKSINGSVHQLEFEFRFDVSSA